MRLISRRRLRYWSAQNPLIHLLVYEPWFRAVVVCFFFFLLFLGLFLPKIWRASPKGFLPIIKVSGLDIVQAWSLERTALKATTAGQFEEAHYAWKAAAAKNQADAELFRGGIRTILKDARRSHNARDALRQSLWLLKLTSTNILDLELVSNVFIREGHLDLLISLLEPRKDRFTPTLEASYLKSLFNRGKINAFRTRWLKVSRRLPSDPELTLYDSAFLVGWGSPGARTAAQARLDAATLDPALRILACRLQLAAYARLFDVDRYLTTLQRLEEWQSDTLIYHIGYWRLLFLSGRKAEAIDLAQTHEDPPASVLETIKLAELFVDLGRRDKALRLLKRSAPSFGEEPSFWISYANELMEAKQWEELRRAAVQIRGQESLHQQLYAYSYFLEGRAELAVSRQFLAETAFHSLAEWGVNEPSLGFSVASQLLRLGFPAIASEVLRKLERDLKGDLNYWMLLFNIADELKQVDLMLAASKRAFELRPLDSVVVNNYAASLIISRQSQEEAIGLTLRLYAQNPRSLAAIVNHSAALLLNHRHREAEFLLKSVNRTHLTRSQTTHYHLDLFELYFGLQQFDQAWAIGSLIETAYLYPPQRQWFDQAWKQLGARSNEG